MNIAHYCRDIQTALPPTFTVLEMTSSDEHMQSVPEIKASFLVNDRKHWNVLDGFGIFYVNKVCDKQPFSSGQNDAHVHSSERNNTWRLLPAIAVSSYLNGKRVFSTTLSRTSICGALFTRSSQLFLTAVCPWWKAVFTWEWLLGHRLTMVEAWESFQHRMNWPLVAIGGLIQYVFQ